jgi:hypothetical protein
MIIRIVVLIIALAMTAASPSEAQGTPARCPRDATAPSGPGTPNKCLPDVTEPKRVRLVRGDILRVDADSGFAYTWQAVHRILLNEHISDSLIAALRERTAVGDSIAALRKDMIAKFEEIVAIQNQAYDSLRARFTTADSLGRESVGNTKAALAYARRVKMASILGSGLVGGVAGGLGIRTGGDRRFDWGGFAIGAALLGGGTWLLLKVVR